MKQFLDKLFRQRSNEKLDPIIKKLEDAAIKIDHFAEKFEGIINESAPHLNPNRRFYLETRDDGNNNITCITIRDRLNPNYDSGKQYLKFEDKDLVYFAASRFNGNNFRSSYYTPKENWSKAKEIEMHFDALEKLGALNCLILNK